MVSTADSMHVGFLRHITGKRSIWQSGGSWDTLAAKEVLQSVDFKSLAMCIGHQQAKIAQWVALRPLLEVFAWETGY